MAMGDGDGGYADGKKKQESEEIAIARNGG